MILAPMVLIGAVFELRLPIWRVVSSSSRPPLPFGTLYWHWAENSTGTNFLMTP